VHRTRSEQCETGRIGARRCRPARTNDSIQAYAAEVSRSKGSRPLINTLSVVYDRARTSDEREFISLIEDYRGRKSFYILETMYLFFHIGLILTFSLFRIAITSSEDWSLKQ
jgi:hypothetical protein